MHEFLSRFALRIALRLPCLIHPSATDVVTQH
jgi:hypothetical protein